MITETLKMANFEQKFFIGNSSKSEKCHAIFIPKIIRPVFGRFLAVFVQKRGRTATNFPGQPSSFFGRF
jgi:hypothetical protein